MKLAGASAARRLAAEAGEDLGGILLHGPDAMLVALTRQEVVAALIGPEGEAEMRLDRLAAADLRRDPALVGDGLRARGFFGGRRVVLVDGATDAVAAPILDALGARRSGDAVLVAAAGSLPARSTLRKGFEAARHAAAIGLYPDPPGRAEIAERLARLGQPRIAPDAAEALLALGRDIDAGAFGQLLETLALYRHGMDGPVETADIAAIEPEATEGDLDALLAAIGAGEVRAVPVQLARLAARGTQPVTIAIAAARHLRALHAAAAAPDGPDAALGRQRPPVFGPRRRAMAEAARRLGLAGTERALGILTDTDLALRSPRPVPGMALLERALVRIASLAAARGAQGR